VTVHADLSPSNVMVSNGRIVILDFAMSRLGHPLQDVARLYAQLELLAMKPQFRRRDVAVLQQALLRGFDPSLDPADAAFRLQMLAQHVNHLASLSTRKRKGLESIYNAFVRRQHVSWLEREVTSGGQPAWG
jgi:aminoglycoside phosphotransferase (APT) family kinase protein